MFDDKTINTAFRDIFLCYTIYQKSVNILAINRTLFLLFFHSISNISFVSTVLQAIKYFEDFASNILRVHFSSLNVLATRR